MLNSRHIIFLVFFANISIAGGQIDSIPPDPPTFNLVTINELTGKVDLTWSKSPSADVVGYIVYYYYYDPQYQGGGYSADYIDTIWGASSGYHSLSRPYTSFRSESYVISAFDSSGRGAGEFSNSLSTIFLQSTLDTCNNKIKLTWNKYSSSPDSVLSYSVFQSIDGNPFSEIIHDLRDTSFFYKEFINYLKYCFIVKASLKSGGVSGSNRSCILTKMQRPPKWINADYATVNNDKKIELSFHIDPLSEIKTFSLERKTGNTGNFSQIAQFTISAPSISYVDNKADIREINYYRLAALNNCGITVIWSNPASNIVLACDQNGDEIRLAWNSYRGWTGGISSYKLFTNTGDGFKEIETISPDDTLFIIKYSDIMFDVTGNEVCFILKALEGSNPYSDPGESSSPAVCIPASVVITVPDIFTPDGNGINDLFSPVLSFTPDEYYLLITDLRRRKVFESRNFNDKWDGRINGSSLPGGVYLWLLETRAPGGEKMTRSGTVTIVFNR